MTAANIATLIVILCGLLAHQGEAFPKYTKQDFKLLGTYVPAGAKTENRKFYYYQPTKVRKTYLNGITTIDCLNVKGDME